MSPRRQIYALGPGRRCGPDRSFAVPSPELRVFYRSAQLTGRGRIQFNVTRVCWYEGLNGGFRRRSASACAVVPAGG